MKYIRYSQDGVGSIPAPHHRTHIRFMRTVIISVLTRLRCSIIQWPILSTQPIRQGRIPVHMYPSSQQELENLTKTTGGKLVHLMNYTRGTRDIHLILSANGSGLLKWWIDASYATYAVHTNMRGHTCGGL